MRTISLAPEKWAYDMNEDQAQKHMPLFEKNDLVFLLDSLPIIDTPENSFKPENAMSVPN